MEDTMELFHLYLNLLCKEVEKVSKVNKIKALSAK